jgi:acyl-coenzyme A synthetase/AMP-(fatty) acid ligase
MKKYKSGYPSIDNTHKENQKFLEKHPFIPNISVTKAIEALSKFYRNETAIDCLDLSLSYDELINNAAIMAKSFKELGIKQGDIITVSMPNYYQAVATYLAANKIGAITTFLNYFSSPDEIKGYLNIFESPLFINYDQNEEYNNKIKEGTKVRNIITLKPVNLNEKTFAQKPTSLVGYHTNIDFNDLELISKYYHYPVIDLHGKKTDSLILFTSGTTGNPKSVLLTNENILASGTYMKNSCDIKAEPGEKCLVCVPFTYPYGFATSTLMSLLCGREAILAPTLSANNIEYYVEKNPNIIFGSPALLELIKRNVDSKLDMSSINTFISGGDFLTPSQNKEGVDFFKLHGADVRICNGSGNAETVGASTNAVGIEPKLDTVGKILVGSDAIIVDENGHELKYGEEGMLCISGKHVFKEYYKEPELTKNAKFMYKGKEYFKTSTLGKLDENGYFTLTGRASRFYIISTLNKIYCDHVQNIMSLIDVIDSIAVVKKPNDKLLYTSKAYIILKKGILPCNEVKEYILQKCQEELKNDNESFALKPYEIPTSIEFVDKFPRTKADKIDYSYLETLAEEEYQNEKQQSLNNPVLIKK